MSKGRRVLFGVAIALVVAGLGVAALVRSFTLRDGQPVTITFAATEPVGHSELDLLRRRADYALQACCVHSTQVVPDPAGGSRVVRLFRVGRDDALVKGNYRSELRLRPNALGQHVWYRAEVFVPADWRPSPRQAIAMQWHGSKDVFLLEPGKYPPLDISIVGAEWRIHKSWDDRIATPPGGAVQGIREIGHAPLQPGRWLRWTVEAHWSSRPDGALRLWLGDRLVVDDRGPNAHRDLLGPYLKAGIYVPSWHYTGPEPDIPDRTLYFTNIAVRYGADPFGQLRPGQEPLS